MNIDYQKIMEISSTAKQTQMGGRSQIEAQQLGNLRRLVEKVRRKSPLFAELYEHAPPSDTVQLQDLPITRKPELMIEFDRWLTDRSLTRARALEHMEDMSNLGVPINDCLVYRTSGTSGEPLIVASSIYALFELPQGVEAVRTDEAQMAKFQKLSDELKNGTGVPVAITGGNGHFAGNTMTQLMQNLNNGPSNFAFISAEEPIEDIVEQLNAFGNVPSIRTYPSVLSILIREKEAGRLHINPISLSLSGETLTEELRQRALTVFPDAFLSSAYSSSECVLLGKECSHGRFHLNEDWVVLEAVDENEQPVADGVLSDDVLLTYLANDVQPFIRYKMGDRVRFYTDPCPCGSPFRSYRVEGRQATILHIGDVALSALAFDLEHEQASRVQLVQTGERAFEIRAEIRAGADVAAVFDKIIAEVQDLLRDNGVSDAVIRKSHQAPKLGNSGKFQEVVPIN